MFHPICLPYFAKLPIPKIKAFQFTVQAAMEDLDNAASTVKGWKARFLAGDWSGETSFFLEMFVFYQSVPGCIEDLSKRPFSHSWLLPAGVQRKEKAAARAAKKAAEAKAKAAAKKQAEKEDQEDDEEFVDPDANWGDEWEYEYEEE